MPGADGMSSKFMKNAFVGWTFTAGLYYPPDFDASKLLPLKALKPRGHKQEQALNIRMMFPFTMVCDGCSEYNYTGTKFTAKVEQIKSESYLGLKVYRFYGRCRHCWAEFTFKTDPKNSDYTMESGGKRTYEAWKDADMVETQLKKEKEDEKADKMKALEQKSVDVQAEMQRLDDLDAIRTLNKRLGQRDESIEAALDFLFRQDAEGDKAKEELSSVEDAELAGFREAQLEEKRRRLDEEVDGSTDEGSSRSVGGSGGGSSGSSSSGGGVALGSHNGDADGDSMGAANDVAEKSRGSSSLRSASVAAAVAERTAASTACRSTVGAKFTVVKRKVPPTASAGDVCTFSTSAASVASGVADADSVGVSDSKRRRTNDVCRDGALADSPNISNADVAVANEAPTNESANNGGGGLCLGAYDSGSDSS
eukprot:TRINITY_DN58716_c0_g1_i1.p1 TRINITY_DN58716_c0_g1~~TRINITY_DN58716_c0_g1_i1.p1  ORF type:complete len:424 (-),score=92.01 TRINITY_DN58716_c0_g1_i1:94-1365(-)